MSREAWSAMFVTFGLVDWEPPMTVGSALAGSASETISSSAPPSWPWRRGVLILAGAAQLMTISALTSADPLAVTWWALLLAIVPAPLAAAAVSQLADGARRLKVIAITGVGCLASARSHDVVAEHVREQLIGPLDLQECRHEYATLVGHPPWPESGWTVLAVMAAGTRSARACLARSWSCGSSAAASPAGVSRRRPGRVPACPGTPAWWPSSWLTRRDAGSRPGCKPLAPS